MSAVVTHRLILVVGETISVCSYQGYRWPGVVRCSQLDEQKAPTALRQLMRLLDMPAAHR